MKIAVYGAGGYTGRLVAAELSRRGIDRVLVGRGPDRLRAVESSHGGEVRVAGIDDGGGLARAFDDCDAVVNCAGPFTSRGEPVVRAAIGAHSHYVDTTAEQLYIKRIFEDCGAAAEAAKVTVVPACGYDIVPGDMLSHLTAAPVEPLSRLTLAYDIRDFGMSRGSMRSVLVMYTGGEVAYGSGEWLPGGGKARRDPVQFPGEERPAATVRWPAGEIVTVPRHVRVRDLEVVMRGDALVPRRVAPIAPSLMPVMTAVMKTPLRGGLDRLVGMLPEGPAEERRRRSRFGFVAEATGEDGRRRRGVLDGVDVYGTTAAIAVEAATRLSAGGVKPGVLAPSQAFEPASFLDRFADRGLSWGVTEA